MALVVLTDLSTATNNRTLSWTVPSLSINDVVVVSGITWDQADTLGTPSGTGLSFTKRAEVSAGARPHVYIWTAVASSGGSSIVVTATAASSSVHSGVLYQCPTGDGYSLAASPNIVNTSGSGSAPSGSITSTSGSLIINASADWDGGTGAVTYVGSATEDGKVQASGDSSQYYYHQTAAGSSTSIGMTAPSPQSWALASVEVLVSAGAAATRGTPFGHRGTAFNGGRTFHGIINREAAWQARQNSWLSAMTRISARGFAHSFC